VEVHSGRRAELGAERAARNFIDVIRQRLLRSGDDEHQPTLDECGVVTSDDAVDAFAHVRIGDLLTEDDWEALVDVGAGRRSVSRSRAGAIDELRQALESVPEVREVTRRLGKEAGARYRSNLEQLECDAQWDVGVESGGGRSRQSRKRKRLTQKALSEKMELVELVAESAHEAADRLIEWKRERREKSRLRREELKRTKRVFIDALNRHDVWMPLPSEYGEWLRNGGERGAQLLQVVKRVRAHLHQHDLGILQYIHRRHFNRRNLLDVQRNIEAMRLLCGGDVMGGGRKD
jgi:hypothetical protein